MGQHSETLDELHLLKQEASRLVSTHAEELRDFSTRKAKSLEHDVKALFGSLCTAIESDEREIGQALADRAATVLTSAIVLGIVIGWTLRKKS
ncbi:MAG TPA: hypothetical protein VHB49_05595 [Bradyrhizobium sp.]|nr:hypothetical protein [Bradyrhizobium sp.]